jgi:ribosomal protein L23
LRPRRTRSEQHPRQGPARHPDRPVVSEKSYGLLDEGKYTFVVDPRANKTEIKIAVEQVFGVKVTGSTRINRRARAPHPLRRRQAQGHQARDRHGREGSDRHLRQRS